MSRVINRVAVLGAGVMGSGIAELLSGVGIEVHLLDIVPSVLTEDEKINNLTLDDLAVRNRFAAEGKKRMTNKSADLIKIGNFTDDLTCVRGCDWIIEVVAENLKIKKSLLKDVFDNWKEGTVVSTNTSGIEINKIVEDLPNNFKSYFLGTHFFNPPRYMKLLEIIPLESTNADVVKDMIAFGENILGKGVIIAKDTPCFIANRIGAYVNSSVFKVMKKYDFNIKDVDAITGPVMGKPKSATFKTIDIIGLDTFYNVFKNLQIQLKGTKEAENFEIPPYLQYLYDNKFLGDKTKQGLYKKVTVGEKKQTFVFDYNSFEYVNFNDKELIGVKNAENKEKLEDKISALVYGSSEDSNFAWDVIKNILIYCADKVPEIADDFKNIDNAVIWGYNWTIGPFQIWDAIGVRKSVQRMKNEGSIISSYVENMLNSGREKFYDSSPKDKSTEVKILIKSDEAVFTEVGDDIVKFTFNTKNNTFNNYLLQRLEECIHKTEDKYNGMIICNNGKNFSAGFDLKSICDYIENNDWKSMENSGFLLQDVLMKIKYSKRYIITAPFNMTVGGGAELVMSSHGSAVYSETAMGLVEAGVGLVPSGGGVKEYLLRAMNDMENFEYLSAFNKIKSAWNDICTCTVTSNGKEAVEKKWISNSKIVMNKDFIEAEAKKIILNMINNNVRKPVKKDIKALGSKGKSALLSIINNMKDGKFISEYDAYIAQKVAHIITGGDIACGTAVSEEYILDLEREAFADLCHHEETKDRIKYLLTTGKHLRN